MPPVSVKVLVTCLVWYVVSATTSQLTKEILTQFPFPSFVGQFQFLISALYCLMISFVLISYPRLNKFPPGTMPSSGILINRVLLKTTLPLGVFQCLGKFCSLAATSRVPVATVASIKSLAPLIIVGGYRVYYKVRFPVLTYVSLIPLVLGVMVIVMSDKNSSLQLDNSTHWNGVLLASLSTLIFASQNIYAKNVVTYNNNTTIQNSMLLNTTAPLKLAINKDPSNLNLTMMDEDYRIPRTEQKLIEQDLQASTNYEKHSKKVLSMNNSITQITKPDKLTILFYCSTLGFIFQIPLLLYELYSRNDIFYHKIPLNLLLLNGTSHCIQLLMLFHLLGSIPTVTYSIASMMKRIVIITVSILVAGHQLNTSQMLGLSLVGIGLYTYDRWSDSSKFGSS